MNAVPEEKEGDRADHLRGAAKMLNEHYPLCLGISGVIEGDLPIGGRSSSAAVIIAFLSALCKVNNIQLTKHEMIMTAKAAENEYVGVSCGKLDQSCEIFCKKSQLLYLDTKDDTYVLIPTNPAMKPYTYKIAIFFSGVERSLASSKYNMRVDECKSAAYALQAFAGIEYGKYENVRLRDVPVEIFEQYKGKLPEQWRKRAQHYYTEEARVKAGAEAWRRGDLEEYGRLSFESGSDELIALYIILCKTPGIYGGRFSGAGFKGCCMALINPDFAEQIAHDVTREYLAAFPQYTGKFSVHICESAEGAVL